MPTLASLMESQDALDRAAEEVARLCRERMRPLRADLTSWPDEAGIVSALDACGRGPEEWYRRIVES